MNCYGFVHMNGAPIVAGSEIQNGLGDSVACWRGRIGDQVMRIELRAESKAQERERSLTIIGCLGPCGMLSAPSSSALP